MRDTEQRDDRDMMGMSISREIQRVNFHREEDMHCRCSTRSDFQVASHNRSRERPTLMVDRRRLSVRTARDDKGTYGTGLEISETFHVILRYKAQGMFPSFYSISSLE